MDEERPSLHIVTLNRPQQLNAMNTQMFHDLRNVFRVLKDDPDVRGVVIAGSERAFSVGGDLKERNGMDVHTWRLQHELIEDVFMNVKDFPWPVVAAVEGHAVGGGFELALMTDFIVAAKNARFALPEMRLGIMPGGGGVQNLSRAIGMRDAKRYLLTGDPMSAVDAHRYGVVTELTAPGNALAVALDIARRICAGAPLSLRYLKLAASRGPEVDFHTGYALDIAAYNVLASSQDRLEGVSAFNEKREPNWKNR
jgi:enoyl-CoA hydratase/carnithine racemase